MLEGLANDYIQRTVKYSKLDNKLNNHKINKCKSVSDTTAVKNAGQMPV